MASIVIESSLGGGRRIATNLDEVNAGCDDSKPGGSPPFRNKSAYWWHSEIASLKEKFLRLSPSVQCAWNRPDANTKSVVDKAAMREIRGVIDRSKSTCREKFCAPPPPNRKKKNSWKKLILRSNKGHIYRSTLPMKLWTIQFTNINISYILALEGHG